MQFSDDPPGKLVRCVYCDRVFGAPVDHNCPEAPDVDPVVEAKIEADPRPDDDIVLVFETGQRYHEEVPSEEGETLCSASAHTETDRIPRSEAQDESLAPCEACANINGVSLDTDDDINLTPE